MRRATHRCVLDANRCLRLCINGICGCSGPGRWRQIHGEPRRLRAIFAVDGCAVRNRLRSALSGQDLLPKDQGLSTGRYPPDSRADLRPPRAGTHACACTLHECTHARNVHILVQLVVDPDILTVAFGD